MTTSTSSGTLCLVDTNVIVHAHDQDSPHHGPAKRLLSRADAPDAALCVTPQILAEFFAVVTNPKRVARPRSPEDALSAIEWILQRPGVTLLPVPTDVVSRWIDLVRRFPVTRQRIFDLQLVATMLGNGVTRLYTFNRADFEHFPQIEVLTPQVS
jgi:toxin-antitoxin system PIN domain toxin